MKTLIAKIISLSFNIKLKMLPIMNGVLPSTMDPMVVNLINTLVLVHVIALCCYIFLLVRSFTKTPADNFRDRYDDFAKKAGKKTLGKDD